MCCEQLSWPTALLNALIYLFSNKNLQQGEINIKPSILEDILVGFNALIRNKLKMMVKEILVYSFCNSNAKSLSLHWKRLINENKVLVDRSSMIHSFTTPLQMPCVTILYNHWAEVALPVQIKTAAWTPCTL